MLSYYVLRPLRSIESESIEGYMEIEDWHGVEGFEDWGVGEPATREPSGPVELEAVPHDGYEGLPDDFSDFTIPLMSKRLKEAFDASGATNLRFHPVTIRNAKTRETYEFFAFNLIGLVSADAARSTIASHDGHILGDSQIHDLVIHDADARGLLVFRLREKFTVILVHQAVKDTIERSGITTIEFVKPEDFMAL